MAMDETWETLGCLATLVTQTAARRAERRAERLCVARTVRQRQAVVSKRHPQPPSRARRSR
jgi:hypothetical protein